MISSNIHWLLPSESEVKLMIISHNIVIGTVLQLILTMKWNTLVKRSKKEEKTKNLTLWNIKGNLCEKFTFTNKDGLCNKWGDGEGKLVRLFQFLSCRDGPWVNNTAGVRAAAHRLLNYKLTLIYNWRTKLFRDSLSGSLTELTE